MTNFEKITKSPETFMYWFYATTMDYRDFGEWQWKTDGDFLNWLKQECKSRKVNGKLIYEDWEW